LVLPIFNVKLILINLKDVIEDAHRKRGNVNQGNFQKGNEAYKLVGMLQDISKQQNITQKQLAAKCVNTETYIFRIETMPAI
jgi:hypothetical protein